MKKKRFRLLIKPIENVNIDTECVIIKADNTAITLDSLRTRVINLL